MRVAAVLTEDGVVVKEEEILFNMSKYNNLELAEAHAELPGQIDEKL